MSRDLELLLSFDDKVSPKLFSQILKDLRLSFPSRTRRKTILKEIVDRHMTPEYIYHVNMYLGEGIRYLPRHRYGLGRRGKMLTAKEVFDQFMYGACSLTETLLKHRGDEFCHSLNDMDQPKIYGSGRYGVVFKHNELTKMSFRPVLKEDKCIDTRYGTVMRFSTAVHELVMSSLVSVISKDENNPHFARMRGCHVCEADERSHLFMEIEEIEGTLGSSASSSLNDDQLHSMLFQHLRAVKMLQLHGITHIDLNDGNVGWSNTDVQFIDYDDGWIVPTFGRVAKIIDFGTCSRYIDPIAVFWKAEVSEIEKGEDPASFFNVVTDPARIIDEYGRLFLKRFRELPKLFSALERCVQFMNERTGTSFKDLLVRGLSVVYIDDLGFIDDLLNSAFPEFKACCTDTTLTSSKRPTPTPLIRQRPRSIL